MIMTSGIVPYEYAGRLPPHSTAAYPIGYSGVLLEQAMWILNAERRRYKGYIDDGEFTWKIYKLDNTTLIFEPTVSGQYLANSGIPVVITPLNYILDLRNNFWRHLLNDGFAEDSDYLPEQYRRDWIHNAYPLSPSGFIESVLQNGDGNYFRGDPPAFGPQLSTDIGILGTSGVLFDIDFGEVLFNPYPRIGRTLFGDGKQLTHRDIEPGFTVSSIDNEFPITMPLSPLFPSFQTTSGTLVSVTSRDIRSGQSRYWMLTTDDVRSQVVYDSLHVGSGVIRLDGDVLLPNSIYQIGDGGVNAREDFRPQGTLGFAASGLRPIGVIRALNYQDGTKVPSGLNSALARVFLTPSPALSSGLYHIAVSNSGQQIPNSVVSSGIVSHWPSGTINRECPGYQVFDDCIYIRDNTHDLNASGLAISSPFTGNFMWVRFADLSNISLFGNLTVPQSSLAFKRLNYPGLCGMVRRDINAIQMVYPIFSASSIDITLTAGQAKLYVANYNDLLNLISTTETPVFASSEITGNRFGDITFDGTSYWICVADGNGNVYQFDSSFNFLHRYDESPAGLQSRRLVFFNSKYWAYAEDNIAAIGGDNEGALSERSFNSGTETVSGGSIKFLDASVLPPNTVFPTADHAVIISIHHVINITNGIHITNGVWALFETQDEDSLNSAISGSERMWLARIEEGASEFTLKEFYPLPLHPVDAQLSLSAQPSYYDMVHLGVNPGLV